MKLHIRNSLNTQGVFSLTSKCLEIANIYDSPNDVSDNGLFQLSGETSCLFKTSIWQATKTDILPSALGFIEDMSHRSILVLEIQGFS